MGIAKHHLSYKDFFKNEINTLGFLHKFPRINSSFNDLASKAQLFYYQYKGKTDVTFQFECVLDVIVEYEQRKVIVEAIVTPDYNLASYVLTIYQGKDNPLHLMRKFHFDFVPNVGFEEMKPIYHLQYGGSATPKMKEQGVKDENILPWLSVPRLNYSPINLALLLDAVFCEFPSEVTTGITERNEWRNFIKMNEEKMLEPYYSWVNNFFQNRHKSNFLYRDFCYGKK